MTGASSFYGTLQARIHHERFGGLAATAAARLTAELGAAGHTSGTVVELGCGSGILARRLLDAGYGVVASDVSPAMVELARAIAPEASVTVAAAVDADVPECVAVCAVGEVCNYAVDARAGLDAIATIAARARSALLPGGLFVLDVATPGRNGGEPVRQVFHSADDWALGMVATEIADPPTLERRITIFAEREHGRFERVEEHHVLHLYDPDAVRAVLERAGFTVAVDARYGPDAPQPPAGWCVFVARRPS